jgi:hypothetical protein
VRLGISFLTELPDQSWVAQRCASANRPSMAGSEACEDLQRAWVAIIMAIQSELGAVKNGNCHLVNLTAGPLVEHVLNEPVQASAAMQPSASEPAGASTG